METDRTYIGTYKMKSMCGFITDHKYCIRLDRDEYGYKVDGVMDLTDEGSELSPAIRLASETSIRRYFDIEKDENNEGN